MRYKKIVFLMLATLFLFSGCYSDAEKQEADGFMTMAEAQEYVGVNQDDILCVHYFADLSNLIIYYNKEEDNLQFIEFLQEKKNGHKVKVVQASGKLGAESWKDSPEQTFSAGFECESAPFEIEITVTKDVPENTLDVFELNDGYFLYFSKIRYGAG